MAWIALTINDWPGYTRPFSLGNKKGEREGSIIKKRRKGEERSLLMHYHLPLYCSLPANGQEIILARNPSQDRGLQSHVTTGAWSCHSHGARPGAVQSQAIVTIWFQVTVSRLTWTALLSTLTISHAKYLFCLGGWFGAFEHWGIRVALKQLPEENECHVTVHEKVSGDLYLTVKSWGLWSKRKFSFLCCFCHQRLFFCVLIPVGVKVDGTDLKKRRQSTMERYNHNTYTCSLWTGLFS